MAVQWYPGHMAKAERNIKEEIKKADVIIFTGDARAVRQSINKGFYNNVKDKKHFSVFNKSDLADEDVTKAWQEYYSKKNEQVFFTDCVSKEGIKQIISYMTELKQNLRYERELRAVISGIPNVGKSMLINALSNKASAKTGNIPGFTRGVNWIKTKGDFYLLDTPGVLPTKFDTEYDGNVLASIGCVKQTVYNSEDLAAFIIEFLSKEYPLFLRSRYLVDPEGKDTIQIYEEIALKRGFKLKGNNIDYLRCARTVIDEFKNGTIGRISFSRPQ